MLGADPDLLDALAVQLTGAAQELQALEVRVGAAVRESPWHGLDAEGLRAQWISRDALLVVAAATRLESAATEVTRNATEQRQASAADGALASSGVASGGVGATLSGAVADGSPGPQAAFGIGVPAEAGPGRIPRTPAEDARSLYKAVDGLGTDEDAIFAILRGKTSTQIDAIRQAYLLQFGVRLDDDLRADFSDTAELDRALLGTLPPRTPEQILEEYTVAPDPAGVPGWTGLTSREIDLFLANPDRALPVRGIGISAGERAALEYGPQTLQNGHGDAFRHAFASALLTREYGEPWANAFTTAHEGNPQGAQASVAMDLYNNEIGRRIAVEHPDASYEELVVLVKQSIENGDVVVVGQDQNLHFSNEIPSDAPAPREGTLAPGDRAPGKEVPPPG